MQISFIKLACLKIFILFSTFAFAQERRGNIVEYFGKETVESLREGSVEHVFEQGLLLKMAGMGFNSSTIPKDPVLARFLLDNPEKIGAGDSCVMNQAGEMAVWETINVKENSEFHSPGLRSGYLYLEYNAPRSTIVLFEASGHTMALINGFPHEGDHYDFGWSLTPIQLKKGKNVFVLKGGRFPKMRARLIRVNKPVALTTRDLTLPDLLLENSDPVTGGIRIMNAQQAWFKGGTLECRIGESILSSAVPDLAPMYVRKVPFQIPVPTGLSGEKTIAVVSLKNKRGASLSSDTLTLSLKSRYNHHKKTFISNIDGSVQYYSVAPSTARDQENQAMFFSVHGASVEAVNQANAYQKKNWGHIVAPTNRRPFGFAWEDWGRLDALEVFDDAQHLLKTNPQQTYLTGHSMGGHGTWYLGATYPDRWAAIAPCAGYPDLLGYRDGFMNRMKSMSEQQLSRMGLSRERLEKILAYEELEKSIDIQLDSIIRRAGNPSRTLKLKNNYLHHGIYILHGEKDTVVPTILAREMRKTLAEFHPDFAYYEYPNGSHWYGNHSMDWPPIFEFFKFRAIKVPNEIEKISFTTASPGVSASSHFVSILQQNKPFELSSFEFVRDSISTITTKNVYTLAIDLDKMEPASKQITIDDQVLEFEDNRSMLYLQNKNGSWVLCARPSTEEKGPHRSGGFKDAFRNNMVFVYGTKGSKEEKEWYYHRALFDAEKFWYRANGNVEIVRDTDFLDAKYKDRNIILYGNKDTNAAWDALLAHAPVQVSSGKMMIGDRILTGDQWGSLFIYPRKDSDTASIGVVTATGINGMKAAYANRYLVNGTTFPDLIVFSDRVLHNGMEGVQGAGFFGNDWTVEKGDFVWRR